jgi:hypothetical protein
MGIEITTEPIEVIVDGVKFFMQGDPSATTDWHTLMEMKVSYGKDREKIHKELVDALAAMAHTPEDADIIRSLDAGTATLERTGKAYVQAVVGFPTPPPSRSTKR